MNEADIAQIAKGVVAEEKNSFRKFNWWTIFGGAVVTVIVWIFTAGQLYSQVSRNTDVNSAQQTVIGAVPVIQQQVQNIETDIREIKETLKDNDKSAKQSIQGLRQEQQQMRQEILDEIRMLR